MLPLFCRAIVMQQDPGGGGVIVMLPGFGQLAGTGVPVKILYQGAADGIRVKQHSLPERGSWGLVCFPQGNIKDGLWMGSYFPNLQDATTFGPTMGGQPTDPNAGVVEYHSHWSGYWSYLDGNGTTCHQWPDSSSMSVGISGEIPTVFRNVVDSSGNRTQQAFGMSDRVANPPAKPFIFNFNHSSGTSIVVDVSGNVTVTNGPNGNINLISPNNNITVNASGTITLACTGNMIATTQGDLDITVQGTTNLNSTGNVNVTTPTMAIDGDLTVTGGITAGEGGGDSVTLQHHTHEQGNDSNGDTEEPTQAPTPGT